MTQILVTSALPYANGPLHLGHLLEYIQTDIWVRFQRLLGNECYYLCGSDTHGTAIMLQAEKRGLSPEQMIEQMRGEQLADFEQFQIRFDHFSSTDTPLNAQFAQEIYLALKARGDICVRTIEQLFDVEKNIFLPDRFIKGECPRCSAKDQYGDNCENCGATYTPSELKNPRSVISGTVPVLKESEHYFFELPHYTEQLKSWLTQETLQPEVRSKLQEWFDSGLQSWDISRDAPYFGIKIPGTENKYFYVWLDAPIGYISATFEFCEKKGLDFSAFWKKDAAYQLYHFIGKDIVYFHTLFWPAMLMGANYRCPTAIFAHGMLTVNGQKMSKSRGTFIKASTYLRHLNPEALRYYYAAKLSAQITDIDLNIDDFRLRVNSDLVGKVVNIASRCAGFIHRYFAGRLAAEIDTTLYDEFVQAGVQIAEHYQAREMGRAVREIMGLADRANQYIDEQKPWQLAKEPSYLPRVHFICSTGLNLFRLLMLYLSPILPQMAEKTEQFLASALAWQHRSSPLLDHVIAEYTPLMVRIDPADIAKVLHESQEDLLVQSFS